MSKPICLNVYVACMCCVYVGYLRVHNVKTYMSKCVRVYMYVIYVRGMRVNGVSKCTRGMSKCIHVYVGCMYCVYVRGMYLNV